jgi:proteic killer suppression protein
MIRSFKDPESEKVFNGQRSRKLPPDIQNVARRKLFYLDLAQRLEDLRVPPANHLEALKGGRKGQHSIRINRQWRICFVWRAGDADHVEIVDYHDSERNT